MTDIKQTLYSASKKVLKPLIKILLEHGVSHAEFNEVAKQAYLEVAEKHFVLPGRKQTTSRLSVLTGLARKDVSRIKKEMEQVVGVKQRRNRPEEVVGGWLRDKDFCDQQGNPLKLPVEGEISFTSLVKRYAGDVPVIAVLDELLRVEVVKEKGDKVYLASKGYIPASSSAERIRLLGNHGADLIKTIEHNIMHSAEESRLQMAIVSRYIPESELLPFHKLTAKKAHALLGELDDALTEVERKDLEKEEEVSLYRAGVGIYYFEEEVDDDNNK